VSSHREKIQRVQGAIRDKLKQQSNQQPSFLVVAHVKKAMLEVFPDVTEDDWKELETTIRNDSRIQESHQELKGETKKVWEWTAPAILD